MKVFEYILNSMEPEDVRKFFNSDCEIKDPDVMAQILVGSLFICNNPFKCFCDIKCDPSKVGYKSKECLENIKNYLNSEMDDDLINRG